MLELSVVVEDTTVDVLLDTVADTTARAACATGVVIIFTVLEELVVVLVESTVESEVVVTGFTTTTPAMSVVSYRVFVSKTIVRSPTTVMLCACAVDRRIKASDGKIMGCTKLSWIGKKD